MEFRKPSVICLAATDLNERGVDCFLDAVEAPDFETDAASDGEELIELAGRMCYKSFHPGLNPNVTKVRHGNRTYIRNLLKQRHFSVLEHVTVTYALLNVTRVCTHEMVRHRVGTAFSQESLRYVRLADLGARWPDAFEALPEETRAWARARMTEVFEYLEIIQQRFAGMMDLDLDGDHASFEVKKLITSAMRRMAPIGLTTNLIMSANLNSWRHIIDLRTSPGAEEEIREVVNLIADDLAGRYPNVFPAAVAGNIR